LTQIAEQVGMHKSTIHRLLTTLEAKRFVMRDKVTGMYQLGYRFIELASILLHDIDIQRWAQPYLHQLAMTSGETVDLAVLDGDHVVYLQVVESPQRVKIAAAIGERLPAYCTATGKAFLAYLPVDKVDGILDRSMEKYTEYTITSREELFRDLWAIRERGYAVSKQEYEHDINAIAAPILNADGCPLAVIAIVGPSFRLSDDCIKLFGESILETTSTIAREIGLAALPVIIPKTANPCNGEYSD
jgi:DNA-binding IclR family transcriptional regulator